MIDWKDGSCQVTPNFTVKECLYLHAWERLADINIEHVYTYRIAALCGKLELIRALVGDKPLNIHSMYRSPQYNESQFIHPHEDVHSESLAVDFDCLPFLGIEDLRQRLRPHLEALGIRMERGTKKWIHIDMREVGPSGREFTA